MVVCVVVGGGGDGGGDVVGWLCCFVCMLGGLCACVGACCVVDLFICVCLWDRSCGGVVDLFVRIIAWLIAFVFVF